MIQKLNLSFRQKIILLPTVAAVAFVLIFLGYQSLTTRNVARLTEIEEGYVPAADMFRDLNAKAKSIRQAMQDAVEAEDPAFVETADRHRAEFVILLADGRANPVVATSTLESIEKNVEDYYARAQNAVGLMLAGEMGPETNLAIERMRSSFSTLQETLETELGTCESLKAQAFDSAAGDLRRSRVYSATIIASALLLLGAVSFTVARGSLRAFGEFSRAFQRMISGDFSRSVEITTRDEIGELGNDLNDMMDYFRGLSDMARSISLGDLAVDVRPRSDKDTFGVAFAEMTLYLHDMAGFARTIARGNVDVDVQPRSEEDSFGVAFKEMTDYLREMADRAGSIAAGDLTVDVRPRSEHDYFGNALRQMVANLRTVMESIHGASEALASSAGRISTSCQQIMEGASKQSRSTDQTSSTMVEMATQIQQLAHNSGDLSSNVDETSASIEQMNVTLTHAAKNAEDLVDAVGETSRTLESMVDSIDGIATRVRSVNEVSKAAVEQARYGSTSLQGSINSIGDRAQEIEKIVTVIEGIADQTNLLSLNAAIEAARAGEAGKGFSVVADEVKRLAERSAQAIQEISGIMKNVQQETAAAVQLNESVLAGIVESIDKTSELIGEATSAAEEQASGTKGVIEVVQKMSGIATQIGTSARENAASAGEVTKAAQNMNRFVREIADSTAEQTSGGETVVRSIEAIAQISRENKAAVEQLSETAQSLSGESDALKRQVSTFRV